MKKPALARPCFISRGFISKGFISIGVLFFCMIFAVSAFAAFPISWQFRKSHVINAAAGAGTGYQVRIKAHYGAGTDSGEDVYLNSKCRTDFGDIRFVSSDGVTELKYWMETGSETDSVSATFWVKVTDDLSAANQTIYIYYGNTTGTVTTTSNGDNAFIFFDDFDSGLGKWTIEKTLNSGFIAIQPGNFLRCGGGQTSNPYGHTSIGSSPAYNSFTDGAIEVRLKQSANALGEIAYRGDFAANTGYKGRFDCRTKSESPHMKPPYYGWRAFGTAVPRFGSGTDTWYRGTVSVTSSGSTYTHRIFKNDVLMSTATDTQYAGPGEIALQNHYGSYTDYDWVAVRKFVYPEPADAAWGAETPLAAVVYSTKSVHMLTDADGNGVVTSGDTLRYDVKIHNTGNVIAQGVTLTDTLPAETTYASAWTASNGTVTYSAGQISWTGYAAADPADTTWTEITFDVTVNPGTPLLTVVSNQGTVSYDSDNNGTNNTNILTDGDPYATGTQTTDFTVGGPAQATGIKSVAMADDADGNGVVTPGDTLEYTIVITNKTGFPSAGIEINDVIPEHTTYVTGSTTVTDRDGTYTIAEPSPPTYPESLLITGITIGAAGSGTEVVTIKFRAKLDKPMAAGVTQISNQAVGFYDSDSDGTNDTHQETDGDTGTVGLQPTVTDLYVGTISGTVFDDNGYGFGTAGDGVQNGGEPGMSGVQVDLYDSVLTWLYQVLTNGNGDYSFTGLIPGTYTVKETNPAYYVSTTYDYGTVTLNNSPVTGDSAVVNFGDQPNGYADLEISKTCATLYADGTNQLAFLVTITNNGPDAATNVVFTDDLTALAGAGLSSITYTEDGGASNPWPGSNTLTWASMASGASHVIRIYATVAASFTPSANTATVISDIYDPDTSNNTASCTNVVSTVGRRAMEFPAVANDSVTVPSSASFDLTTQGTLEAWIYPTEFVEDAGILMKGSSNACYGFGLGGGGAGDVFSEGTSQNIGFVLYDDIGGKYILTADNYTLTAKQWYHIACVWSGSAPGDIDMNIYINGVLEKSGTVTFVSPRQVSTNSEDLSIGFQNITSGNFVGDIDEVRIWDVARTQTRIRDTMCHKLTSAETDYANLAGNWRFDEDSGPVCNDASGNDNLGSSNAVRVCSSAPIGDDSAHDYSGSAAADFQVLNFPSGHGDTLTVTGDTGAWDEAPASSPPYKSGLQVYRVDEAPNITDVPFGWRLFSTSDNPLWYWGVFVTGGSSPTYKIDYHYDGYPGVVNDDKLRLAFRHNNCDFWKDADAGVNTGTKIISQSGFNGTEFILGTDMEPRNAIDFDGSNDYVGVPDENSLDLGATGTLEAWVNISAHTPNGGIIHKGDLSSATDEAYYLRLAAGTNQIVLGLDNGGGTTTTITSATTLNTNTWYHIAGVWNSGTPAMNLYINGVLDQTGASATTPRDSTGGLNIGAQYTTVGSESPFQGKIDEVRVWNTARTQTQIRDNMCKKLVGNEAGLMGYWRFDQESTSTTCPDYDFGTKNNGTMYNFGTVIDARICSSAPIGDDSAYGYGTSTGVSSATLTHSDGDYFFATESGGTWNNKFSGIQVYRLDEAPVYPPDIGTSPYAFATNGLTPPQPPASGSKWSSIDYYRYWGVFLTYWTTASQPQYTVEYDYNGNPSVPVDETQLGLAKRDAYCDRTWADSSATLNTVAHTLTTTNQTQNSPSKTYTEYVLGGKDKPLAIALASFTAEADPDGKCIVVSWKTAQEIDTIGFQLRRSDRRDGDYTVIEDSFQKSKATAETQGASYAYKDCHVDLTGGASYYYKLEEIDFNSTKDNPLYGPIGPVSETESASQVSNTRTTLSSEAKTGSSDNSGCFISVIR